MGFAHEQAKRLDALEERLMAGPGGAVTTATTVTNVSPAVRQATQNGSITSVEEVGTSETDVVTLDRLAEIAGERGLLDDPIIVDRLGEARALCEAARVLTYKVIDLRAKGSPPTADTQLARVLGTRADTAI